MPTLEKGPLAKSPATISDPVYMVSEQESQLSLIEKQRRNWEGTRQDYTDQGYTDQGS